MDKDTLKGVAIVVGVALVLLVIFFIGSGAGPDDAKCIADAMRSGVPTSKIEQLCHLGKH